MNPKPPVHPNGKSRWFTTRAARVKSLVAAGAITVGFAGAGLAVAGPASADPGTNYVAVGSNTTQSIMDAFAATTGGLVGSYDAVDPVTGGTLDTVNAFENNGSSSKLQAFLRPNGSGDGFTALRYSNDSGVSLTPYDSGTTAQMPAKGAITFSRSSASPTSVAGAANLSTTGQYQWIPFAYDNVAVSTGPSTAITHANLFTFADLTTLYKNCGTVAEGGVTYWPLGSPVTKPAGAVTIDLYVPQSGSGSRNFWLDEFTGQHSSLPACVFDTEQAGPNVGKSLEENNGTIDSDDPNAIFPYSAGQWLFQKSAGGTGDLRDGAVLNPVVVSGTAISPLNAAGTALNTTTFPIFRELYNVFITSQVTGSTADPNLVGMFVGPNSALCQSTGIIKSFGFVSLASSTQAPDPCGSTSNTLRAFAGG
jgi:hypothetical protein